MSSSLQVSRTSASSVRLTPQLTAPATIPARQPQRTCLAKRIIACLDVRANDQGDLVVTKGDLIDGKFKIADVDEKSVTILTKGLSEPLKINFDEL